MLKNSKCSIYDYRPMTCCSYDCRVFTASGIAAGETDKARITQRAKQWKFNYPTELDREEHEAVRSAAKFIQEHAACFPGGAVPTSPSQLAILAIKVYDLFLTKDAGSHAETAKAIVQAVRTFDVQMVVKG